MPQLAKPREYYIARLERLCATAEHCSFECLKKLIGWGFSRAEAAKIVDELIENRFIDDYRFARAFVADKYRFAMWGRRKIKAGLLLKHIPESIIADALNTIDEDIYTNNLLHIISRKKKSLGDLDGYTLRQKLMQFAASRGFELSLATKIIDSEG